MLNRKFKKFNQIFLHISSNIPIYNSLNICYLHLNILHVKREFNIHSQATKEKGESEKFSANPSVLH
jgi:hypothetical protein